MVNMNWNLSKIIKTTPELLAHGRCENEWVQCEMYVPLCIFYADEMELNTAWRNLSISGCDRYLLFPLNT